MDLPCGMAVTDGQSNTFRFENTVALRLVWAFVGQTFAHQLVMLMRVNPRGRDVVEIEARAVAVGWFTFRPVEGVLYYIRLLGHPIRDMTWYNCNSVSLSLPRSVLAPWLIMLNRDD